MLRLRFRTGPRLLVGIDDQHASDCIEQNARTLGNACKLRTHRDQSRHAKRGGNDRDMRRCSALSIASPASRSRGSDISSDGSKSSAIRTVSSGSSISGAALRPCKTAISCVPTSSRSAIRSTKQWIAGRTQSCRGFDRCTVPCRGRARASPDLGEGRSVQRLVVEQADVRGRIAAAGPPTAAPSASSRARTVACA